MNLTRLDFPSIIGIRQDVPVPQVPYSGSGDIVTSGWESWISSGRAFSFATIGTNLIRVRRVSDNAEQDFATTSSGAVDSGAITTFLTATSGKIVKFYDQSGNSRHLEQATAAQQAAVNLSGIGSRVTADFTAASTQTYSTSGTVTIAYPCSLTAVYNLPTGSQCIWSGSDGLNNAALFQNLDGANTATIYSGSDCFATCSFGSWHAICGTAIAVSSGDINIDGTSNTGNSGPNSAPFSADNLVLGVFSGGSLLNGKFAEGGVNSTSISTANSLSMFNNAKAFWGW